MEFSNYADNHMPVNMSFLLVVSYIWNLAIMLTITCLLTCRYKKIIILFVFEILKFHLLLMLLHILCVELVDVFCTEEIHNVLDIFQADLMSLE